jgi:hypothetical protein
MGLTLSDLPLSPAGTGRAQVVPAMPEAKHHCSIRGSAAGRLLGFLRQELGEASLDRIVSAVDAAQAGAPLVDMLLQDPPDERLVLPVRVSVEVLARAGDLYCSDSGGAPALAERAGAFAAREDQALLKRFGSRVLGTEQLVRSAPQLWHSYASCGNLTPTEVGANTFLLSLEGFHDAQPLWCRCLTGYFRELVQRASGKQARVVEVQCAAEGAPVCEWHGDWNGASLF